MIARHVIDTFGLLAFTVYVLLAIGVVTLGVFSVARAVAGRYHRENA